MEFLADLWLPIVLSAVFVFLVSSVLHMLVPLHKSDFEPLPNESEVLAAMREHGVGPGDYMFPHCDDMKALGSPEMLAKFEQGPVGNMTVLPPGPPAMGKALGQWFVYCLVISVFVAYVASFAVGAGADYMEVFRLTGTVAFLGYGVGAATNSIWKGVKWSSTWKFVFDGLLYALATAGTFGWLH